MKDVWIRLESWDKDLVTTALESGADAVVAPSALKERIEALGRIRVIPTEGPTSEDVRLETLRTPDDEERIARWLAEGRQVVVENTDWEIIPLENLVARGGRLLVSVDSEARLDVALGVLEKGASGVVFTPSDPAHVREWVKRIKSMASPVVLNEATVIRVEPVGLGDRVCVDTCLLMHEGQGALVGNSAGFLFLVQAETRENPYVAPRPFRINAGAVHAYIRVPEGRTRYLSELQAGERVLVVDASGNTVEAVVGRSKIERRPLLLVEAETPSGRGGIVLQNAETICLTSPDGEAVSVGALEPGTRVLVAEEAAARHFGMAVDESIVEK